MLPKGSPLSCYVVFETNGDLMDPGVDWEFYVGLSALTLVVIGLFIYLGKKLDRAVRRKSPDTNLPLEVTTSGTIVFAFMVAMWTACLVVQASHPDSTIGSFLRTFDGVGAIAIGSVLYCGVAGAVLDKLGYPLAKKGKPE